MVVTSGYKKWCFFLLENKCLIVVEIHKENKKSKTWFISKNWILAYRAMRFIHPNRDIDRESVSRHLVKNMMTMWSVKIKLLYSWFIKPSDIQYTDLEHILGISLPGNSYKMRHYVYCESIKISICLNSSISCGLVRTCSRSWLLDLCGFEFLSCHLMSNVYRQSLTYIHTHAHCYCVIHLRFSFCHK